MSKATVNVGAAPDDGTGDTLRAAFVKVQANFDELYNLLSGSIVVGAGAGGAPLTYSNLTYSEASGPRLTVGGSTAAAGITITGGTITANSNPLLITSTRNAAGVTFDGALKIVLTDTASAAGSLAMQILGGASGTTNLLSLSKAGSLVLDDSSGSATTLRINNSSGVQQLGVVPSNSTTLTCANSIAAAGGTIVIGSTGLLLAGGWNCIQGLNGSPGNTLYFGATSATAGGATVRTEINKAVTSFTDGVAKTVFTLTIPNAAHSASYLVRLTGSIGAGGAIGANEASATNAYIVTICRTAGVNAVAGISAAFGASTSAVAGATTVTCTAALAAVSGAVGATNTIDIQATITKGGGASNNHTCVATASLLNANATGITIA